MIYVFLVLLTSWDCERRECPVTSPSVLRPAAAGCFQPRMAYSARMARTASSRVAVRTPIATADERHHRQQRRHPGERGAVPRGDAVEQRF